jgi:hypothetical protein
MEWVGCLQECKEWIKKKKINMATQITPVKSLDELEKMPRGTRVKIQRTCEGHEEDEAAIHKIRYNHGMRGMGVSQFEFVFPGQGTDSEWRAWRINLFPEWDIYGCYEGKIFADFGSYSDVNIRDGNNPDVRETLRLAGYT